MWRKSSTLRHPLFPELKAAEADKARGSHPALAGTFLQLWHAGLRCAAARRAIFLVHDSGSPWVAESEREMLWRLFEVPVLGLLVNERREVLAYECEAQQGMHLNSSPWSVPDAGVDSSGCICGRSGQRLVPAASILSAAERELPLAV